jgi:hypothetical protein
MKKVCFVLGLLLFNGSFLACTPTGETASDDLYETVATGDDGEVNDDPDGNN